MKVKAGVDITHPDFVLMLIGVPFPWYQRVRTKSAFVPQSHHILGGISCVRDFQTYIFDLDISFRFDLKMNITDTVEPESSLTYDIKVPALLCRFPIDGSVIVVGDMETSGFQGFLSVGCFDDKYHFFCQNGIRDRITESVVGIVTSDNLAR